MSAMELSLDDLIKKKKVGGKGAGKGKKGPKGVKKTEATTAMKKAVPPKKAAAAAPSIDMSLDDIRKMGAKKKASAKKPEPKAAGKGKMEAKKAVAKGAGTKKTALANKRDLANKVNQRVKKQEQKTTAKGKGKGKAATKSTRKAAAPRRATKSSNGKGAQGGGNGYKEWRDDSSWSNNRGSDYGWNKWDDWNDSWKSNNDQGWGSGSKGERKGNSKGWGKPAGKGNKGWDDWSKSESGWKASGGNNDFLRDDYQPSKNDGPAKTFRGKNGGRATIKISNCPAGLNKNELRQAFQDVGKVRDVRLEPLERAAYLVFEESRHAYEAEHQFDGGEINGSTISIQVLK